MVEPAPSTRKLPYPQNTANMTSQPAGDDDDGDRHTPAVAHSGTGNDPVPVQNIHMPHDTRPQRDRQQRYSQGGSWQNSGSSRHPSISQQTSNPPPNAQSGSPYFPAVHNSPSYSYGPSFPSQYPIHPQSPVGAPGAPGFPYPYNPMQPESNMMATANVQNYQQLLQYQLQSSSPSANPVSYGPYDSSPLQLPQSTMVASGSPIQVSPQFQSNRFASPLPSPQFPYSPGMYPSLPVYPPQFVSPYGPQQYPSPTPESDSQGGTWWYVPVSNSQFDPTQTPYPYPSTSYRSHDSQRLDPSHPRFSSPSPNPVQLGTSADIRSPASPLLPFPPLGQPSSSSSSLRQQTGSNPGPSTQILPHEKNPVRKSYHPHPPPARSEWVMWVGNVPQDTTHDELWHFFNQASTTPPSPSASPPETDTPTGVVSIFLISRSSCAFVNFESEVHLDAAIGRFNGMPLRSIDPRCPRLVCRVRRKEDDLKAGVGGQRGMGMHTKWVKDQQRAGTPTSPGGVGSRSPSSVSETIERRISSISLSSEDEAPGSYGRRTTKQSTNNSSGSYASTNSGFLIRHFPKRYFILKSLSQYDLDLSVKTGLWATQKHNEGILDQAYRTSKDVYLIFGVNKSGEFYGYAKMLGPIRQGEKRVSWASRPPSSPTSSRPRTSPSDILSTVPATSSRTDSDASFNREHFFLAPSDRNRIVDNSPDALPSGNSPDQTHLHEPRTGFTAGSIPNNPALPAGLGRIDTLSAPAILGPKAPSLSKSVPGSGHSLDALDVKAKVIASEYNQQDHNFELDYTAPIRAIKNNTDNSSGSGGAADNTARGGVGSSYIEAFLPSNPGRPWITPSLSVLAEENTPETDVLDEGEEGDEKDEKGKGVEVDVDPDVTWGESFRVEWVQTERMPFFRTKHLRNPWNHDREVKVSRDGTELEPGVGQLLLEEWEMLEIQKGEEVEEEEGPSEATSPSDEG